jgi:hypothetical protein
MRKRKYHLDEGLFNYINSEAKAYWLGFLAADGSLSRYSLALELNNKDINQIKKFRHFLKSNHPIKPTRKNCSRLRVNSVILNQSLIELGIHPNKTSNIQAPPIQPKLLRHFYRGVFDGDGWITFRKNKNSNGTYCSTGLKTWEFGFSSGSYVFINEIHKWLCNNLGFHCGSFAARQRKNQRVYQLVFGGNSLFLKIMDILYKNSHYHLTRKLKKVKKAKESILLHRKKISYEAR